MKHIGNLIITKENQTKFKELTEVSGYLDIREKATLTAPKLTEVSDYLYIRENATLTAPKLEKSDSLDIRENATLTAPKLTEISDYLYIRENVTLTAPKLEKSGSLDIRENATLTAPKLEKSDSLDISENATLTAPKLTIKNNTAKIKNKKYNIVFNDNISFFIFDTKTSKGIKIHTGLLNISYKKGKLIERAGYLVEKGDFSAHGKSVKKAINDLQFKIVSEKLKNEPIKENTIITVERYRIITGACDVGCRNFMTKYNIPFKIKNKGKDNEVTISAKKITAKELLLLLEKDNAYGYEKLKGLVTF